MHSMGRAAFKIRPRVMHYVNIRRNILLHAEMLVLVGVATSPSLACILEHKVHTRGLPHGLPEALHLGLIAVVMAIVMTGHDG